MNLLPPPTDNLYKFISIAGLTSMIGGLILFFTTIDKADELAVKYRGEERILQKELNLISEELDYNTKYKKLNDSLSKSIDILLNRTKSSQSLKDSVYRQILYNLPDSIKSEFKKVILKKEELANSRDLVNFNTSLSENYRVPYLIMLYGGEIFALFGFLFWWDKTQRLTNKSEHNKVLAETNKLLSMDLWQTHCQSCLKTIRLKKERGTEIDGKYNRVFCINCYKDGGFTEPDLQYSSALKNLKMEYKKLNYSRFRIYKHSKNLKNCIRWAGKFNW